VDPLSPYAIDKYATERYVLAYGKLFDLPTVCVRFFNVYGPRQNPNSPYSGVLSILTECLKNKKRFTLFGDGTQTRDFIYVEDVIQALGLITKKHIQHQVINIANGNELTLNNIISTYEKVSKQELIKNRAASRSGEVKHSVADIGRLTNLGYSARWSLEDGLSQYWKGVSKE